MKALTYLVVLVLGFFMIGCAPMMPRYPMGYGGAYLGGPCAGGIRNDYGHLTCVPIYVQPPVMYGYGAVQQPSYQYQPPQYAQQPSATPQPQQAPSGDCTAVVNGKTYHGVTIHNDKGEYGCRVEGLFTDEQIKEKEKKLDTQFQKYHTK